MFRGTYDSITFRPSGCLTKRLFTLHILSGWWFGTFFMFPYIGNVIIPIDFHIFQRGWYTTNQLFPLPGPW